MCNLIQLGSHLGEQKLWLVSSGLGHSQANWLDLDKKTCRSGMVWSLDKGFTKGTWVFCLYTEGRVDWGKVSWERSEWRGINCNSRSIVFLFLLLFLALIHEEREKLYIRDAFLVFQTLIPINLFAQSINLDALSMEKVFKKIYCRRKSYETSKIVSYCDGYNESSGVWWFSYLF